MTNMKQHLPLFLSYLSIERRYSQHTIDAYTSDLTDFFEFSSHETASLSSATLLHAYTTSLVQKSLSKTTISRKLSCIRSFCKFLKGEGILTEDIHSFITLPKKTQKLPSTIDETQISRLFEATLYTDSPFPKRDIAIMELLYGSGLRISECLSITLDDLNIKEGVLSVSGKGQKKRMLPLGDHALRSVKGYLYDEREAELSSTLFLNNKHLPFTRLSLYKLIKSYFKKAGLASHFSPHSLRHSFATHLLNHHADLREVQELLGHVSIETTQLYTKVAHSKLKHVFEHAHPRN